MERGPGSPPLAAGIEQEIADLYEKEAGGILRYAGVVASNKETAHDALQEAFLPFLPVPYRRPADPVSQGLAVPRGAQLCPGSEEGGLAA